ncbi:MAG TPA: hypothetical protein VJV23_00015 [Candidatus Polarisedimenticolia bacterium]|nr:hypothetical protein [Candidatus Polarisedimenticolia bacterium]
MNLSFLKKHRFHVVVGAAAVAMVLVAVVGDLAVASNMGFKLNKQLVRGTNLIAMPFRTPTQTAQQLCAVFGKTTAATSLAQFTGTAIQSYTCDQLTAGFNMINKGVGVRIIESTTAATGIIVGSHIPGQSVTIPDAGAFPVGTIVYAYPYHTTNVNSRDVCQNGALTTTAPAPLLTRFGPGGGVDATYTCDQTASPGFPLRLGEGIQISGENNGPKVFVPSHF